VFKTPIDSSAHPGLQEHSYVSEVKLNRTVFRVFLVWVDGTKMKKGGGTLGRTILHFAL